MASDPWEEKTAFVRRFYEEKGYRVHSGLQFGCELVLYADDPERVHSDFCIHVVQDGKYFFEFDYCGFGSGRRNSLKSSAHTPFLL